MRHIKGMLVALCFMVTVNLSIPAQTTTIKDIDGNTYNTVTIGTQTWMQENLKVTKFRNGDPIPNVKDSLQWENNKTAAYCAYKNSDANAKKYGYLYNWYTVVDPRNLCPTGWHVPSIDEVSDLGSYLKNWEENEVAKTLAAKSGWENSYTSGALGYDQANNNSTGFTALPGGCRYVYSQFLYLNSSAYWWTLSEVPVAKDEYDEMLELVDGSSTEPSIESYNFRLTSGQKLLINDASLKEYGFSVRCIKDK
jgi:uncharacterized protein (TIGR02145 family)